MDKILLPQNPDRIDLMAGIIEHLACYIQSERPRSAHLAALLLDRLAQDHAIDDPLRERCRELGEVLDDRVRGGLTLPGDRRAGPRLSWENLTEAA